MKKTNQTEKKLSLKKLQLIKVTNLQKIRGGNAVEGEGEPCKDPDNASKPDQGLQTPTQ
ncbi:MULTISPECIES: hypothetical protein [Elizabethkingia]|uniref:hypothetical protein n=1 Tax=Elizabethkingia TaxID=308865 RepID=UPI00143D5115|nr:hypothetical protein [Elizabethkingia sp. 2-6]